ncbi:restriction endonuclease subunit S [Bacillus halotolerans]|uniref:restriction endonuclease subunit S n=1 Tax=Bacillus halotolerans TaxID=260554 RepID=UPI003305E022
MGNKRVPEVRFEGFNGDWEERKFSNIVGRVSKQSNDATLPKVEFEDIVSGEGRLNKDILKKFDARKGIVFEPNFILFGKLRPYLKNWLLPNFKGIALGDFWVFEPKNSYSIFNYYLIQTDKYQIVANLSSGTKMPRSDWKTVSETEFRIPSIEEQTKIGNFFKQLDDTIAFHQQELTTLKQTKQGFLQKMFPKEGESVPEVRFLGFDGEWEEHRLGEVFEQTSNYVNPREENLELWSLTVENGLTPKTERYNREFLVKKEDQFKSVSDNEFIYNPMNMTLGAVDLNLTGKKVAVSGYYITMKTTDIYDSKYFGIWLKTPLAIKMYKLYATGSLIERQRVQFPTFSQIKALVPSKEEQTQIGNFFKQLDDTIALHQRELDALKETKKAFLQKMFV